MIDDFSSSAECAQECLAGRKIRQSVVVKLKKSDVIFKFCTPLPTRLPYRSPTCSSVGFIIGKGGGGLFVIDCFIPRLDGN